MKRIQQEVERELTAVEAALALEVSVATLYRLARAGLLRRRRYLGQKLFLRGDIERLARLRATRDFAPPRTMRRPGKGDR